MSTGLKGSGRAGARPQRWLALAQIVYALGLMLTIIAIPFGVAALKIALLSFNPLGKEVVSSEAARGRLVPVVR